MTEKVQIAVPALTDGEGDILQISLEKDEGQYHDKLWIIGISNLTDDNIESIRAAIRAAQNLTGKTFMNDITLRLGETRKNITGNSWQLMLALGFCSLLTGKPLKEGLTGTGSIRFDGRVQEVSSIPQKVWASLLHGYKIFLISDETNLKNIQIGGMRIQIVTDLRQAWHIASGSTIGWPPEVHARALNISRQW